VSTPTPGPGQGPITYPETQSFAAYPPLDHTADQAPAPQKRGLGAGAIIGMIAGAGLIAVTAGTIGGGVGYLVARETLPTTTTAATGGTLDALPSTVPGSIAEIAAKVQPAVVQLNVSGSEGDGTGSGFVISNDGYIVTNNHVAGVAANGGTIDVVFSDGSTAPGKLIGANANYDLAVVKVDKANVPTVPLGSSDALAVGDSVIAVGSPLGLSGTVTTGIVSALNRPVTAGGEGGGDTAFINAIQTDAAITGIEVGEHSEVRAPGTLASHYAPTARVVLITADEAAELTPDDARTGLLALAEIPTPAGIVRVAAPASIDEYARVLYAALREVDALALTRVVAVPPSPEGVGAAVVDRLKRAATTA